MPSDRYKVTRDTDILGGPIIKVERQADLGETLVGIGCFVYLTAQLMKAAIFIVVATIFGVIWFFRTYTKLAVTLTLIISCIVGYAYLAPAVQRAQEATRKKEAVAAAIATVKALPKLEIQNAEGWYTNELRKSYTLKDKWGWLRPDPNYPNPDHHDAITAIDGDLGTLLELSIKKNISDNGAHWLDLRLGSYQTVSGIAIYSDNNPGDLLYPTMRDASLKFSDGTYQRISLDNLIGWQYFVLKPTRTDMIRLFVNYLYAGGQAVEMAEISELELHGTP